MIEGIREFTTVLRGESALIFRRGESISVNLDFGSGKVLIIYSTRWLERPHPVDECGTRANGQGAQQAQSMPGHLIARVQGHYAGNAQETMEAHAAAALTLLPLFSLVSNAAVGDMQIEVGYESTSGLAEREYFQCQIPQESGQPRPAQIAPIPEITGVMECFGASPHRDRLLRASNQYLLALQNWSLGHESLAVEHLWMAVEAITKSVLRDELQARSLTTDDELAASLGVDKKKLDATLRKDIILSGDAQCYRDALEASDGLEHGFLEYGPMRKKAVGIRNRLALLVRKAILKLAKVEVSHQATLTSSPYEKPVGMHPLAKYIRGKLVGAGDDLAAPGNLYPFLEWRTDVRPDGQEEESGVRRYKFEEQIAPRFAEGIGFSGGSVEVWH